MQAASTISSPPVDRRGLLFVISLCALSAAAGRLAYLRHPWDNDSAMFVYTGKAIAEGARFCHDLCDNKFPTSGLWSAACWRVFGTSWPAYVLFQTTLALATVCILTCIVRRWAGYAAAAPAFLFALVYVNFWPVVFGGFQLETPQMFFATVAAAFATDALINDRPAAAFVAGLASGCAVFLKPTGLAVLGAYGLACLCIAYRRAHQLGWRRALGRLMLHATAAATGLAIPLLGALLYLVRADILRDMPHLYRQISAYAAESVWDGFTLLKLAVAAALIGGPMLIGRRLDRVRSAENCDAASGDAVSPSSDARPQLLLFASLWLAAEAAGVILQRRLYGYHFLVLAAPAALLFGLVRRRPARPVSQLVPLMPAIALSLWGAGWAIFQRPAVARLPLSDYLATHAVAGDRVWMDNMPRLLLETGARPGSRHVITFPFFNTDAAPLEMGAQLLEDLRTQRPRFIILPTDCPTMLDRHCGFVTELVNRPVRRANYKAIWAAILRRVASDYRPAAIVGDRTVYVRSEID